MLLKLNQSGEIIFKSGHTAHHAQIIGKKISGLSRCLIQLRSYDEFIGFNNIKSILEEYFRDYMRHYVEQVLPEWPDWTIFVRPFGLFWKMSLFLLWLLLVNIWTRLGHFLYRFLPTKIRKNLQYKCLVHYLYASNHTLTKWGQHNGHIHHQMVPGLNPSIGNFIENLSAVSCKENMKIPKYRNRTEQ